MFNENFNEDINENFNEKSEKSEKSNILSTMLFADKYRPTSISEVIGNRTHIQQIKDWIMKFDDGKKTVGQSKKQRKINITFFEDDDDTGDNNEVEIGGGDSENIGDENDDTKKPKGKSTTNVQHSSLLISGKHGVGKTCTVTNTIKQMGYVVQNVNVAKKCAIKLKSAKISSKQTENKKNNKNLEKLIDKVINGINICDNLNEREQEKKVILIDEIESINAQTEKNFVLALLKKNEMYWHCPVIFISNGKHSKLATVIKKNANIIYFDEPSDKNLKKLLVKVYEEEELYFEDETIANKIIVNSQNDYRRLLQITEDLKLSHGKKKITNEMVDEYLDLCKTKDLDLDIYRVATDMTLKYTGMIDCLRLYESEKVIIPLMLHQNYIKCINNYHKNKNDKYDLISSIAKSMAMGDVLEDYIYSDQNWDMQEIHGFLTCVYPSYRLTKEKLDAHPAWLPKMLKFPADFNRTSIKFINKKNVTNSNVCLKNMEIMDFITANKLVKNLLADGKIIECADIFGGYGAKADNIESMLKINKISETKPVLASSIKKKLSILLG
jgi:DNA polymerase III delta prime subunit